ncbi:carboxypeptidase [Ehrlichia ruminantium]|uniref:Metal-dependent carboxypeptidase n=1 Tax=Ehrlichia ruminantium TaxID=779 RepID=A0AAE6QDG3_EHRRU|nr:carboxypeptidase [Ehrlichia ruminantium]QGR02625.1 carboxypeptidase [Ehrlichia ruminantium]QGR03545.1 carboxypeptidase [Ehrlichia ruminantium]QGR04472.1 carboxypeptidase [Ehrlichia ruminantium]
MKYYKFLEEVFEKVGHINSVINVLKTSKSSVDEKIEHICTLEEIRHEMITSDMVNEMIQYSLANKAKLNEWELANLNHIEMIYKNSNMVPLELIVELFKARIKCQNCWLSFHQGDVSIQDVISLLSEVIRLVSEITVIKAENLKISKYDVILGAQDCKLNTKKIDGIFTEIGAFFRQFMTEVSNKQKQVKIYYPKDIDENKQVNLGYDCLSYFGITHDNVNIDCQKFESNKYLLRENVGFSINYDKNNYKVGLKSLLKRVGYTLCILNLPVKWYNQPICWNMSSIIPGVLSFLISEHLMMSKEFISFIAPKLKKQFSLRGRVGYYENVQSYFNQVQPSLFMHKSDEVTLLAHIMLRYTLEKEMINDTLQVQDLPDAWIQGMKHYFNITPDNDFEGFLQDDCWVNGIFGHVPCSIISLVIASQMFSMMQKDQPQILLEVEKGDFSLFLSWVNKNICHYGAKYNSTDFLKKISGQKLNVSFYKNYLVDKYLKV